MSIGYGDIVLVRCVEYIVGIRCQIGDGIIWVTYRLRQQCAA